MCKESKHFPLATRPLHPNPLPKRARELWRQGEVELGGDMKQVSKDNSHSHHDDQEETAHGHPHTHQAHDQEHHLHDDIVSLAHRSHDHKHPIHLQPGSANFRQNACHAGDGHNHGGESNGPMMGMNFGLKQPQSGGHHHEDGEHAHCPNCDEHMEGDSCNSCGYHEHHD